MLFLTTNPRGLSTFQPSRFYSSCEHLQKDGRIRSYAWPGCLSPVRNLIRPNREWHWLPLFIVVIVLRHKLQTAFALLEQVPYIAIILLRDIYHSSDCPWHNPIISCRTQIYLARQIGDRNNTLFLNPIWSHYLHGISSLSEFRHLREPTRKWQSIVRKTSTELQS